MRLAPARPANESEPAARWRVQRRWVRFRRDGATHRRPERRPVADRKNLSRTRAAAAREKVMVVPTGVRRLKRGRVAPRRQVERERRSALSTGATGVTAGVRNWPSPPTRDPAAVEVSSWKW